MTSPHDVARAIDRANGMRHLRGMNKPAYSYLARLHWRGGPDPISGDPQGPNLYKVLNTAIDVCMAEYCVAEVLMVLPLGDMHLGMVDSSDNLYAHAYPHGAGEGPDWVADRMQRLVDDTIRALAKGK